MNSNISHQTSHLSCSPHSFYNSKLLLYVSNYLICVYFCFSKGILKETSQTKIPVRYLIPILNIYHHALGKGNLAERVVYPYKEWRITQILSLSNYTINSDNHKTFPENFLQWVQLVRQKPFKFLTYLSLRTAVFCFYTILLPKVCVDKTRSAEQRTDRIRQ